MTTSDRTWIALAISVILLATFAYCCVEVPSGQNYLTATFGGQEPGMKRYVIDGREYWADRIEQQAAFTLVFRLYRGTRSADVVVKQYVGYDTDGGDDK
jgi:hypothetical protein